MGEVEVQVLPRLRRDAAGVELTGREHHLRWLAVDQVPVDVDVVERVELPDLLQLLVGVLEEQGIPQADVADRLGVLGEVGLGEALVVVEAADLDLGEAERDARAVDVSPDVRRFLLRLVRLHAELLHNRGNRATDDHRSERPQRDRDDRQGPAAQPDVVEEQAEGEERDHRQQHEGGQLYVHCGVAGAVDEAAGGEVELVALEPVAGRLEEGEDAEQHRKVGLHLRRHPLRRGHLHADPTVEIVGDRRHDEHDHHRRERPADDEVQERPVPDDVYSLSVVDWNVTKHEAQSAPNCLFGQNVCF